MNLLNKRGTGLNKGLVVGVMLLNVAFFVGAIAVIAIAVKWIIS